MYRNIIQLPFMNFLVTTNYSFISSITCNSKSMRTPEHYSCIWSGLSTWQYGWSQSVMYLFEMFHCIWFQLYSLKSFRNVSCQTQLCEHNINICVGLYLFSCWVVKYPFRDRHGNLSLVINYVVCKHKVCAIYHSLYK